MTERGNLTEFEGRLLLAIGATKRFCRPGYLADELGLVKRGRKPQAYARVVGAALNRLKARGLAVREWQRAGPGQFENWGWELTHKGIIKLDEFRRLGFPQ